jgi:hypothetical protein
VETVVSLLPYVLPPLAGAVIGYVTNALAIRMLFRPLTEKRFLGIRVPLTPGIIPRQRHQLAHSIARMVSTKLLTEDVLLARVDDPRFGEALETSVGRFTSDILSGERGPAPVDPSAADDDRRTPPGDALDADDESSGDDVRGSVAEVAEGLLKSFFHSDAFADVVRRVADSVSRGALAMQADRALPRPERLAELVDGAVRSLASGPTAPAAELAVQRWVASHLEKNTPMVEIVGAGSIERLAGTIPGVYEPALDALISFLRQPATREELAIHGRALLKRILRRLNLFQRFLVSATQYDRNLNENMPAVVDDLIESVERGGRQRENRDRLIESVQVEIRELGETGVRTLLERFGLHAERLVTRLFALAVELLGRDDVRARISDGVVRFVDKHRTRTVGELAGELLGLDADELPGRIVAVADNWIAQDENAERLAGRVVEFAVRYLSRAEREPLGAILPVSPEQKATVDHFLAARLHGLVRKRVPEIVAGLDVYTMVVEKIEGLDMESVEQLLLIVIARHLKWINLFGAILGSLIGGAQVVIGMVT